MSYIVAATKNAHKVEEYRELLKDQNVEIKSLLDYPGYIEVEESGSTFQENAEIKAVAACKYCDVPAFADDSGLEVEALDGAPGIFSARYAPTDSERIAKLLKALEGKENRKAQFRTAICLIEGGEKHLFEGIVKGEIIREKKGSSGFGYDPVFVPEGYSETFAEMGAEEKNRISHRARAVQRLCDYLNSK